VSHLIHLFLSEQEKTRREEDEQLSHDGYEIA
jgi:hypothetical protein